MMYLFDVYKLSGSLAVDLLLSTVSQELSTLQTHVGQPNFDLDSFRDMWRCNGAIFDLLKQNCFAS